MNVEELLGKYDRRVPRYTSYPTAPQFKPMPDDRVYRGWLGALDRDTKLSVYIHVPFCGSLCLFCGCHTTVAWRDGPMLAYTRTMLQEIDLVADAIERSGGSRLAVRHVHWGGGTPTALPAECMLAIAERLRARFAFDADAEIAVEVDPRRLSDESLSAIGTMGATRASLGVQDFDPVVQRCIGRTQSYETTSDCAERLRGIGVTSLNLDLIYGLPYQTTDGVAATVETALRIKPDRVAVFGYAHVPWMKKQQMLMPESALPGPASRFAQREMAEDTISRAGYETIGLDHFALPSDELAVSSRETRLRRNFQGYTTDDAPALIGFGASSIGSLPQGYVQNEPSVPKWRAAVADGQLPVARGIALSDEDRLRRDIIEQVMCHFAVDLEMTAAAHGYGIATLDSASEGLADLARDGLVERDGSMVRVTTEGRPFVRAVAATFDAYLSTGLGRHAATV